MTMKIDYVKAVLNKKRLDILFLQETEIPDGYNMSLLKIPGFRLECELKSCWVTRLDWSVTFVKTFLLKDSLRKKILMLFF